MLRRRVYRSLLAASMLMLASSAFAQSPELKTTPADNKVTVGPSRVDNVPGNGKGDLQSEVDMLKAENAAVRELLRKMEEQQKALLENVERLQRRLDGNAVVQPVQLSPQPAETTTEPIAAPDATSAASISDKPAAAKPDDDDHYQDGIIIWETSEDAKVPFLLKFTNTTQVRYLNTLASVDTFTDHLGVVREVNKRNDITVNRSMFVFNGYIFDKRARYNLTVWTSAGAASIVVAGNIGWQFNKALTITGGYTGGPGSRSLVNTFPFFTATDRSMADNFFRPSFTQGIWANGEPVKNLHYLAFVGNGLNTLNISATKIDTNLLVSGTTWWEPLGPYGPPGRARNMYDDYFAEDKLRIRLGTAFTRSREDRFSNLDQSSPDNTSIHNSDGVLTFSTGAFAPGVTVQEALYKMWAIDGGAKWRGFAANGQYYFRWLSDFEADGPLPIASTFDHGFELSAGKFVVPKKLMVYVRGSAIFGQFADSHEYAGGLKWHFLPTERLWLSAELMRVQRVPYGGAFTPYTPGLTGWVPMIQSVLAF
ncbi:MAG TPA: hypothetical protein VFS76_16570 [Pyrinomonadaceae bacterium]|nr:hypothetical protein [Pyrinomonadaceae bacterium]